MIFWWFWGIYRTEYIVGCLQNVNELLSTDMHIIVYSSTDKRIDIQCTWKEKATVAYFKALPGIRGWELSKTAESFRYCNRCPGRN